MPNLQNAKKALRQSIKRGQRNKIVKAEIHSLRVKVRKALTAKNVEEATETARLVGKKLDKAVQKNVYKRNTVARYKSRIMKKINALKKA
ncbi:30S ribosomal protein S20 [Candidatus Uhrbacteria bacterium]|nr:30S ribosomal protein S20 [Candidatus Uhrbacteria bacterium]